MKRVFAIILAVMMLSAVLSACGSPDNTDASDAGASSNNAAVGDKTATDANGKIISGNGSSDISGSNSGSGAGSSGNSGQSGSYSDGSFGDSGSGSSSQQGKGNRQNNINSEVTEDEVVQIIATLPNEEDLKNAPDL